MVVKKTERRRRKRGREGQTGIGREGRREV